MSSFNASDCTLHIPHKESTDPIQVHENWLYIERWANQQAPACFGAGLRFHTVVVAASDSQLRGQHVDFQGDGTPTGDLAAFNDAITVCQGNGNQGGAIMLLEGNYHLDTAPTDLEHITLIGQGNGTVINIVGAQTVLQGTADCIISDIQFYSPDGAGEPAIIAEGDVLIKNCYFNSCGVLTQGAGDIRTNIDNCTFTGNLANGVNLVDLSGVGDSISNCWFRALTTNDASATFAINAAAGSHVHNCRFLAVTADRGIYLGSSGGITDCYFDFDCTWETAAVELPGDCSMSTTIILSSFGGSATAAVSMSNSVLGSNVIRQTGSVPCIVTDTGSSITTNRIERDAGSPGVYVQVTGDGNIVANNVFLNIVTGTTGIDVSGNNNYLAPNTFQNSGGTDINDTGAGNTVTPAIDY